MKTVYNADITVFFISFVIASFIVIMNFTMDKKHKNIIK